MAKRKLAHELNHALDLAAALARGGKAKEGVQGVLALIEAASSNIEVQNIMDGATERGFLCQFYPMGMGVRVEWRN